jgi:hypothetical protein
MAIDLSNEIIASDITSGTISPARLGSGTADSTTYLRGDNTWQKFNGAISVQSVTSSANVTATSSNDLVDITAQSVGLTIANPTGTFTNGQVLEYRIKDNGSAQTIAFGTSFNAFGSALPTTTTAGKKMLLMVQYDSNTSKFNVLPKIEEQ